MSVKATSYRTIKLQPTTTTAYTISQFTDTTLDSEDEYRVICENGCSLTQKSSTGFQISVSYNSPLNQATAYLEFLRSGI